MAAGDAWIAYAWPFHFVAARAEGLDVVYPVPKEGPYFWLCGFVLFNGTENYFHAHEYVNAWISASSGLWLLQNYAYGHSNIGVDISKVNPELVQIFSLDDPTVLQAPNTVVESWIPRRDVYQELWDEVKAA